MRFGKITPKLSTNLKAASWVKAYENTLSSAATSVTISNLVGDTDKEYMLEFKFVNGYNGAIAWIMLFNNDSGTNYGQQLIYNNSASTVAASRTTRASVGLGGAAALDSIGYAHCIIHAKSGYLRTTIYSITDTIVTTSVGRILKICNVWNNTADEITSLVISATQADGLGIGTNIILWKKVAK